MTRLAALLLTASLLPAADWPMGGRDATRNPVSLEKGAPADWHVDGRNVRWSAKLGHRSIGGPVVAGGLVWVGTVEHDPDRDTDLAVLACFRERDGKPLWRHATPRRDRQDRDWPTQSLSGSPLAEGGRLYFVTNRREVLCLDVGPLQKGTGEPKVLWKFDMVESLKIRPQTMMIPSPDQLGSPASCGDLLFVPTGNGLAEDHETVPAPDAPSLVCLEKKSGKVVWADNSPGKGLIPGHASSPMVVAAGGKALVVHGKGDGWVRAFEAETGKLVWKFDPNVPGAKFTRGDDNTKFSVMAGPVSAGGRLFFALGQHIERFEAPGRVLCIDPGKFGDVSPHSGGKANPNSALVWEYDGKGRPEPERMSSTLSACAVSDGLVVVPDIRGVVHCLDERTGKHLWAHDVKGSIHGSPLVADGKIYVGDQDGIVTALALGRAKKVLARRDVERPVYAGPVFANGTLYVLAEGVLYAIAEKR